MSSTPLPTLLGDLLRHPALNLLGIAATAACPDGEVEGEILELMGRQIDAGLLDKLDPAAAWPVLARGLMGEMPSRMFHALRACGAMERLLPEVEALFGVPQSADDPPTVDLGEHVLRVIDAAARVQAPLAVRFAALVVGVGKADSPPEHLPFHYRHVERGLLRIQDIARRFDVPSECGELAVLALHEVERVHRGTPARAGPIAAMLERLGAFVRPEPFHDLLVLCACDFHAYPGRATRSYPAAVLLIQALEACTGLEAGAVDVEILRERRALAIAKALGSARWGDGAGG